MRGWWGELDREMERGSAKESVEGRRGKKVLLGGGMSYGADQQWRRKRRDLHMARDRDRLLEVKGQIQGEKAERFSA